MYTAKYTKSSSTTELITIPVFYNKGTLRGDSYGPRLSNNIRQAFLHRGLVTHNLVDGETYVPKNYHRFSSL